MAATHSGGRLFVVQQMQKVLRDRVAAGFHFDAPAVARVLVPIEQHRSQRRQQRIGNGARSGFAVVQTLGTHAAEHRNAGAQTRPWDAWMAAAVRAPA